MVLTSQQLRSGFLVGDRLAQPALNRIGGPDGEAHLEPKVMAVLVCLAEHAGEVVSRSTLYDAVWGRAVVSDQALTNCISELRHHLGDDRARPRFIETVPKRGYRLIAPVRPAGDAGADGRPTDERSPTPGWRLPALVAAVLLGGLAVAGLAVWLARGTSGTGPSVVVVPFDNAGAEGLDYLRLALPDEITTLLTSSRALAVRPFEHGESGTPLDVGRSRNAGHVVTGHYYLEEENRLIVAIEAQAVERERLIWRAQITAEADDLLGMRERIAERVRRGLLPALGVATDDGFHPRPESAEAYQNYLRSLALPRHPGPTVRAIEMLWRTVALDPDFAPAWMELGRRWYEYGTYGDGGEQAREYALASYQKAQELDPGSIGAAVSIVVMRTEAGDLGAAYSEARRLVERYGDSAEAHRALAYVFKFGGLLDASQRHCETAFEHDPHNPQLRSCAYSYLYAGQLDSVQRFLEVDEGSYFSHWGMVLLHLRRQDSAAALDAARQVSPELPTRRFMEPCLEGQRGQALDEPAALFIAHWSQRGEPELYYALAPMLEYCGRRQDALAFLERATELNFCAWPALDLDPAWHAIREDAEFGQLREDAIACHERFRESMDVAAQ